LRQDYRRGAGELVRSGWYEIIRVLHRGGQSSSIIFNHLPGRHVLILYDTTERVRVQKSLRAVRDKQSAQFSLAQAFLQPVRGAPTSRLFLFEYP
jgi:hypothetical protein